VALDSPRARRSSGPRLIRGSLAVTLALAIALLAPVSPASAHDALTGTNPEEGQAVKVVPGAIELTFSSMPLAIGTTVILEDAGGRDWAAGEVKIVDNMVSQPVSPGTPAGEYTVIWRVVSSDGHPIEGTFGFTAKSGDAGVSSSPTAGPQPAADLSEGPEASKPAAFPLGPVLGSAAGLLVLAVITVVAVRRRSDKSGSR
jgi:methionine-rich copper-binding protein CopC